PHNPRTEAPRTDAEPKAQRRKLPDERKAITHKFSIGGHEGYLTVGPYEDNTPGELFVVMAKEGSVVSGLMDSFATAISLALQYGVPQIGRASCRERAQIPGRGVGVSKTELKALDDTNNLER